MRCTIAGCKKRCRTPEEMQLHRRCHLGDKHYVCCFAACYRAFRTPAHLERHLASHSDTAVPVAPGQKIWQVQSRIINPDGSLHIQWLRLPGPGGDTLPAASRPEPQQVLPAGTLAAAAAAPQPGSMPPDRPPDRPPSPPPALTMAQTAAPSPPARSTRAPCPLQQHTDNEPGAAYWVEPPAWPQTAAWAMPTPEGSGFRSVPPVSTIPAWATTAWPACWPEALPDGSTLPPLPAHFSYRPPLTTPASHPAQELWADTLFDPWLPPPEADAWPAAWQDPAPDRATDRATDSFWW